MFAVVKIGTCMTFSCTVCFQGCKHSKQHQAFPWSQLRLNRWRDRKCEQKVSNMEELIVLLIVSLQSFCLVSVSFGWEQTLPCVFYKMACLPETGQNGWESASGRKTITHEWTYCSRDTPCCCFAVPKTNISGAPDFLLTFPSCFVTNVLVLSPAKTRNTHTHRHTHPKDT